MKPISIKELKYGDILIHQVTFTLALYFSKHADGHRLCPAGGVTEFGISDGQLKENYYFAFRAQPIT